MFSPGCSIPGTKQVKLASNNPDILDPREVEDFDAAADAEGSDDEMLSRPPTHRPPTAEGRSQQPLLKEERRRPSIASALSAGDEERGRSALHGSRRLRSRTPDYIAKNETRRKYFVAAAFLILSLVSFTVQTETAVYIQHVLHWDKPYCML